MAGANSSSGSIVNSYSFSQATAIGDGTGEYSAGLVGLNNSGTVETSYSTGLVTGSSRSAQGLIGYDHEGNGTFEKSYWDTDTAEQTSSAGGVGKSTTEMQQKTTYVGWDFVDVWSISKGFDYPDLIDNPR